MPRWKTAVITGGARGLGAGFVEVLRAQGTEVVVSDVREDALRDYVDALPPGPAAHAIPCDVSSPEQVQALHDAALERLGRIDLWVNNAGIAVGGPAETTSVEAWRRIVDINLLGVAWGCRAVAPTMMAAGKGHIINVASAAGLVCGPEMAAYNTTKIAVDGLSRSLALDLAPHGVGVTVLCPTFFKTGLIDDAEADERQRRIVTKLMNKAKLSSADVARAALNDAARGRLYSVPMFDGRLGWWIRRFFPESAGAILRWMFGQVSTRAAR